MTEKMWVLAVDDNPNNLRLLNSILQDLDVGMRASLNASSALNSLNAQAVDLILLDIQLPDTDGIQ